MGDNIIQVTFVHVTCRRRRQRKQRKSEFNFCSINYLYKSNTTKHTNTHTQTDLTKRKRNEKTTRKKTNQAGLKKVRKATRVWVPGENKPAAPCETMTSCVANRLCREEFRCN